ncbi:MAG TPA: RidA family protein [Bryobacteraceae bacterium]|nr:RidA family protein [Bryobacteraceae bacterium]
MKRHSIEIEGFRHDAPIPAACKIGQLLVTSVIAGKDPKTGKVPDGMEAQCALVFLHVRRVIEAASGTTGDILKMTVWLKDEAHRKILNQEWLKMFPDADSRPARHTFTGQVLPGNILVQVEFWAVLDR